MKRADLLFPVRASNIDHVSACPASARMSSLAPVRKSGPEAERGTRLHSLATNWLISGDPPLDFDQLDEADQIQLRLAVRKAKEIADQLFPHGYAAKSEVPLPLANIEDFGTGDVVLIEPNSNMGLVIDWKFGRLEVEEAETNLQLASYAVGAAQAYQLDGVYVVVIQPWADPPVNGPVSYDKADLKARKKQLEGIVAASQAEDAPFNPSVETCRFCPAKLYCVHAQVKGVLSAPSGDKDWLLETPQGMSDFLTFAIQARAAMKNLIEPRVEKIKEFVESGGEIPGFELVPGALTRKVTDTLAAWKSLSAHLSDKEFCDLCEVSIVDLEEAYYRKMKALNPKFTKKQASEFVENALASVQALEMSRKRGSLKAKKEVKVIE